MTVEIPSPVPKLAKKEPAAHRMYLPAVYRYSCLGAFSASSLQRGSVGKCRGISSNLEHLLDMNPSTRKEAVTNFTGEGVDVEDDVGLIEDGRPNPALIYPHVPLPSADKNNSTTTMTTTTPLPVVEDEESKILKETWTAFGSTEVEVLQLTDLKTGKTEIVAVSPYNAAVVSSRKIEMKDRTVSSTELGIGPYKMQFLIESGVVREDLEDMPPPALEDMRKEEEAQRKEKKNNKSGQADNNEVPYDPSTAIIPTFESAQQFYASSTVFFGKMYNFSGKIVDKMGSNFNWISHNLQDDFASRTAASGRRILEQMPKSAALLNKVIKQMFGRDDGREDR